jgi:phosphoglycerate dehydrogenase-like enzyme
MSEPVTVVIQGVESVDEVPGLAAIAGRAEFRCASSLDTLRAALPGAQVMLGWNFRADDLESAWDQARDLRWIHWCGAGVDALLFPTLVNSDVTVTNARTIFDRPMAEYALGLILAMAKDLPRTLRSQAQRRWDYRLAERIEGHRVLVVGTGSIGRAIGEMLRSVGMEVAMMGRTAREGDAQFDRILGVADLDAHLAEADYVVLITPLTAATRGLFQAAQFHAMKPTARFINLGRGALVDEAALLRVLTDGGIDAAASDVFEVEPLPDTHPLWDAPNFIVSPHMSGDVKDYHALMAEQFLRNFEDYTSGRDLTHVVDKALGFVAG